MIGLITALLAVASVFVRRRAAPAELRQQLAWLAYVGALTLAFAVAAIAYGLATGGGSTWVDTVFNKKDFQLAQSGNSVRSDPDAIFSDMYDQTRVNGGSIQ